MAEEFLKRWEDGRIVSCDDLNLFQIEAYKQMERVFIASDGRSYALVPWDKVSPRDLKREAEAEAFWNPPIKNINK